MISWIIVIVFLILSLASILDLKYKAVPSVLLSATLFFVLILNPKNLLFGVLGFLLSIAVKDLISDFSGMELGMADIKIMAIIGLLITSVTAFLQYAVIFSVLQFGYVLIWHKINSKEKEIPFVPCLLAVYITLLLFGIISFS